MRALLLRRTAFLATLVTGLALCASAVHGVSGMDTRLQLAASTSERPTFVSGPAPSWDCPDRPRHDDTARHRI